MRNALTAVMIALLVAQVATGSRMLHFCPAPMAAATHGDVPAEPQDHDGHAHVHIGPGSHGHSHAHDGSHACSVAKQSRAHSSKAKVRHSAARAAPISIGFGAIGDPEASAPDQQTPDRHECAILGAGKLAANADVSLPQLTDSADPDFSAWEPGHGGWFVHHGTVSCVQWPRPPDAKPSPPGSRELLASLCRFLL